MMFNYCMFCSIFIQFYCQKNSRKDQKSRMKLLDCLVFLSMFGCLNGISPVIATSTAEKRHPKTNQVKLKRREIIDYVDSSKPILFGGSYNLVSEWTGKRDPLNSDQSFVYRHSTDLSNRKRKREGGPKSDGKTKIGKTQKNKTSSNKHKENKKNSKRGKTFDDSLSGKTKGVVSKEADFRSPWNYNAWNVGMFRKAARCVDIPSNMSLCRGVGYDRMRVPNLLDHDSELEAVVQCGFVCFVAIINCSIVRFVNNFNRCIRTDLL